MPAKIVPPTKVCLAFLQEPGFRPGTPDRTILSYRDSQYVHKKLLKLSMSGKRLHMAFGNEFFKRIVWDNVNWRPRWFAVGLDGPDYEWIERRIVDVHPSLIITFGTVARDALIDMAPPVPMLHCHHPNARFKTQADLDSFAAEVKARMLQ